MKRILAFLLCALTLCLAVADEVMKVRYVTVEKTDGTSTKYDVSQVDSIYFGADQSLNVVYGGVLVQTVSASDLKQVTFDEEDVVVPEGTEVQITWNGSEVKVVNPFASSGVTITTNGGDVQINSTTSDEIEYVLDGESSDGSLKIYSAKKYQLTLKGLSLTNPTGAAINSQSKKKMELKAQKGYENTLTDGSTYSDGVDGEDMKGCVFSEGQIIVKGAGTLTVNGNYKHGICSDDYVNIENSTLTVTSASDAIHANDSVNILGGTIILKPQNDGIDCEGPVTLNLDDDSKLDITVTGDDNSGVKSDSIVKVLAGNTIITVKGNGAKGVKSDGTIDIEGGTLDITNSGGTYDDSSEDDSSSSTDEKSYKVYVTLPQNGGGMGGMSTGAWTSVYLYKSDGTLVQKLSSAVTISTGTQSATFYYYDFKAADSGTYYFQSDNYTSRGGSGTYTIKSGTFTGPTSGSNVYYTISNSYSTSGSTRTYSITNTTSTWANGGTSTAEGDLSSAHCIKGDTQVLINGGDITLTVTGQAGKAISSDDDITVNAGNITIKNTGAGLTSGSTNYSAKGFTSDNTINLIGGTISVSVSGAGGKGIKCDGQLVIGSKATGEGPTLTVTTTGSSLGSSGSTGGGFGPGGGGEQSGGSSAKAIKAQGTIYIYGGNMTVGTASDGAEGLESKTAIYIEGGTNYFKCYDDCINSNGCIFFNGGNTICYGTGNDAVDSNAGKTGAITIGNGNVFAFSTKGSPEEGLDCDNNSYIQITGTGIAISAGASQGGGSSSSTISNAKQGYAFVTSTISYTSGRYYTLADASGNNLVTYSFPASCSSTLALFTATGMVNGSTYNVKYSTTKPTDATTVVGGGSGQAGLYIGSSATGTTSVTSFTAK